MLCFFVARILFFLLVIAALLVAALRLTLFLAFVRAPFLADALRFALEICITIIPIHDPNIIEVINSCFVTENS